MKQNNFLITDDLLAEMDQIQIFGGAATNNTDDDVYNKCPIYNGCVIKNYCTAVPHKQCTFADCNN